MFDFNFDNTSGIALSLIPALLNFAILGWILFRLPETRLTSIFACFTLILAMWQVDDTLLRIVTTHQAAVMWDNFLSPFWILLGPVSIHFALLYTEKLKSYNTRYMMLLIYGPAAIFTPIFYIEVFPHIYVYDNLWGWVDYHENHWLDELIIYWISILVSTACIILLKHAGTVKEDKQLYRQSVLIAAGITIPTIAGLGFQVIPAIIFKQPAIPVTSTFMTFFSITTAVALWRYKLFSAHDLVHNDQVINEIPVLTFSITEDFRINYMNDYCAEILGHNRNAVTTLWLHDFIRFSPDNSRNQFKSVMKSALKGLPVKNFETSILAGDRILNLQVSAKPLINNNIVQGVLFTALDITELKRSVELIKIKELQLEEAQQISHVGSWEWNLENNKITWSDELYKIFEWEPGKVNIDLETITNRLHIQDHDRVLQILHECITSGNSEEFHTRIQSENNEYLMLHCRVQIVKSDNCKVIKLHGTVQNVTRQFLEEEKLRIQNEELQKLNHELDKFVYSVTHDLRAPLLSIKGIAEITEAETTEELTSTHMQMIRASVNRLDTFIADILDYSRNARLDLKCQPVNFKIVLEEIIQDLAHLNSGVNVSIHVDQPEEFYTDLSRIKVVLSNIISNALNYYNPAVEKPFLKINVHCDHETAVITAEDNGLGISNESQEKIFNMFYRASEKSQGSGLGLYLVKETLNKMQGTIHVKSEISKGSEFIIEIPNRFYQ